MIPEFPHTPLIDRLTAHVRKSPLKTWLWSDTALLMLRADPASLPDLPACPDVAMNALEHLEKFRPWERWLDRDTFLRSARERLERGLVVFSVVEDDTLASFIWLEPDKREICYSEVDQCIPVEEGAWARFNAVTHPAFRRRGYYRKCVIAAMRHAFFERQCRAMYMSTDPAHPVTRDVNFALGFKAHALLTRRRRFGSDRKACQLLAGRDVPSKH